MELAIELHRHSGGSDRYSVIGEPESRLPAAEDKLALRLEEQYQRIRRQLSDIICQL